MNGFRGGFEIVEHDHATFSGNDAKEDALSPRNEWLSFCSRAKEGTTFNLKPTAT
jgi:hypothetical protein